MCAHVCVREFFMRVAQNPHSLPPTNPPQPHPINSQLLSLADVLHKRVVGQDEAVDAVAQAVLRSRAGLARPEQPTGSFLFLGPTGVGKSELAKALAQELFDDERHMVRALRRGCLNGWGACWSVGPYVCMVTYERGHD